MKLRSKSTTRTNYAKFAFLSTAAMIAISSAQPTWARTLDVHGQDPEMAAGMGAGLVGAAKSAAQGSTDDGHLRPPFGDANYQFATYLLQGLPSGVKANMKLEEILSAQSESNVVKDAVAKAVRNSLAQAAVGFNLKGVSQQLQSGSINVQAQALKLSTQLMESIKAELKNKTLNKDYTMKLIIAPRLQDDLRQRRLLQQGGAGEVRPNILYPRDRLPLIEAWIDAGGRTAEEQMNGDVDQGISARLADVFEQTPGTPQFVAASIQINLIAAGGRLDAAESSLQTQAVTSVPINKTIPFTEGNEQIKFSVVAFPEIKETWDNFSASNYPSAIVTISQSFDSSAEIPMLVQFGRIGTYDVKAGQWKRPVDADEKKMVPRLIGEVQKAGPVGGALARAIGADFSIFNLQMNLASLQVTGLDLFIAAGPSALPGVRLGFINKDDIDQQFTNKINDGIKQQIADQKTKLPAEASTAIDSVLNKEVTAATGGKVKAIDPAVSQALVKALFDQVPGLKK